ncbi:hypothetical protein CG724_36670 [Streptomyces sp. CB02120-2]|nr:hypothetical protein CG724_36670 [Streptomyces sp. CB02120-2]
MIVWPLRVAVTVNWSSSGAPCSRQRLTWCSMASQMRSGPPCRTVQAPPASVRAAHEPAFTSISPAEAAASHPRVPRMFAGFGQRLTDTAPHSPQTAVWRDYTARVTASAR